jgi:hypothetical protein
MPGGTSAGFKRDISPGNRDVVIRSEERINPDATGKVLGGPIYRVLTSCGGDMDSGILLRCPG